MPSFGRQVLNTTGIPVMALADLDRADWKPGGITLDWATISAVASDTTLSDGTVIPNGYKGLEFGTILCQKDTQEVQTITVNGSPTGGSYTVTGNGTTSAAIAYNAAATAVQTAIRALGGSYAQVAVTGSAGGPYTITFPIGSGDVTQLALGTNSLTGGSSPAPAFATSTAGAATGTYGPYDSTATDGRQNLARGFSFILNETVLQTSAQGIVGIATDNPAVFDGGLVWKARLKIGGNNAAWIGGSGLQPTLSAFETAFPRIRYAL